MQLLDIKQESYFPQHFKIFGGILIFGAVTSLALAQPGASVARVLVAFLLILLGALMIFTRYGLKVDPYKKSYTIYAFLLGLKIGNPVHFHSIEKFYINQVTEQSLATTRTGAKFDLKKRVYKAFILLDSGEKVHLDTDKDQVSLQKRIAQYQVALHSLYQPSPS